MSSDSSLAIFRKGMGPDFNDLAEEHLKHDLEPSDREALKKGASTVSRHVTIGSLVGLGLGVYLAYRLRRARTGLFNAFKTHDKPVALKYADGREEAMPDLTASMKPSIIGDIATYGLLGIGGLFVGGETGLLTGSFRAKRSRVWRNPESRQRIQKAFRAFQADALRRQAKAIEQGDRRVMF